MDIKMPLMDGFAATAEIRSLKPQLPVVAITAYAQDIDREKVLTSGFSDYISKPVERNQLNKILRKTWLHSNDITSYLSIMQPDENR
jgi:CheY-like chemotaxis protein